MPGLFLTYNIKKRIASISFINNTPFVFTSSPQNYCVLPYNPKRLHTTVVCHLRPQDLLLSCGYYFFPFFAIFFPQLL